MMPMTYPATRVNALSGKGVPELNARVAIHMAGHGPVETTRADWAEIVKEMALLTLDTA